MHSTGNQMFKKIIWNTSVVLLITILIGSEIRAFSGTSLPGTEPWVDPAPVPFDPTEPRYPKPPTPNPYPEPPLPSPLPINSFKDLYELIAQLREEVRHLDTRIQILEGNIYNTRTKEYLRYSDSKSCQTFISLVKTAIRKLIKVKNNPKLADRKLNSEFLLELFRANLLTHIPPFHSQLKGSLSQNLYCAESSVDE